MATDSELIQIQDAAMAEGVRRSGAWIACRPGCFECCLGPFPITLNDARRLRRGLGELTAADPARAARVMERARAAGDDSGDDPCPALDPATGTCDLYAARPVTCRTFGPAVSRGDALGVCELCYRGATDEEIAACRVELDTRELDGPENDEDTTVAIALIGSIPAGCPAST